MLINDDIFIRYFKDNLSEEKIYRSIALYHIDSKIISNIVSMHLTLTL